MKNRYLISCSSKGRYQDERFFDFFLHAILFTSGEAISISKNRVANSQLIIMDRRKKKIVEIMTTDQYGNIDEISVNLAKYVIKERKKRQ